jgi:hypothetical protein
LTEYHNDLPIINAKLLILRELHDPNNERCAASGAKKNVTETARYAIVQKITFQEDAMKLLKLMVFVLAAVVLLTGCLYMDVKTPYDTDLNKTVLGQKTGKAYSQSVLWLFAWGDAGTQAAAKDGNITTVNHMDHEMYSILFGLYTKSTTVVYGD